MNEALSHVAKQWFARALALCVIGPICSQIASRVIAPDGSHNTTFLNAYSPGLLPLVLILAITLAFTFAIAVIADRKEALLNAAFVLGWITWTSGRMGAMYKFTPESSTFIKASLEAFLISAAMIGVLAITPKSKHHHDHDITRFDLTFLKKSLFTSTGAITLVIALIAGLIVSTILGQSDLPGQSVGVGFFAGIAGGLAGTLAATSTNKSKQHTPTPYAPLCIAIMLCGVIAPLIGLINPGPTQILELTLANNLPGYLIVSPIAWIMGALLGVPVGHSWVEHTTNQATSTVAKTALKAPLKS